MNADICTLWITPGIPQMASKLNLKSVDIGNRASAGSIVYEALRKAIIDGDLEDGTPLRQDDIAGQFNTSRIPVREALSKLEQEGLVKNRRYRGAVVAGISLREASEIFDFRILMEGEVIGASVPNMTSASLSKARGYCEEFHRTEDSKNWSKLNRKFHYSLYRDSGLKYHLAMIDNALDRTERYVHAQLSISQGVAKAHDEHLAILEACENGNAELASRLTREHISSVRDELLEHLGGRR